MAVVRSKLVKQLSKSFPNIPLKDTKKIIEIILSEMKNALKRSESVEIRNWGRISVRNQKSGIRRNPKFGNKVAVPAKKVLHWKMSQEMFKKINDEKE